MKKPILFLIMLLTFSISFGQAYIVTFIKGDVFHNGKPVKLHDHLDGAMQLTSTDKEAEIALFSVSKGKMRLPFANGKPIASKQLAGHSELYQLVVADYLQGYTAQKALTTRSAATVGGFFNYIDKKHPQNRVFLVEGERLHITGDNDKFFFCTVNGIDTLCTSVNIIKDSLVIDRKLIKSIAADNKKNPKRVTCLIKNGYTNEGKYSEEYFSQPVQLTFLTTFYLKDLIEPFVDGLFDFYHGDKGKLIADIEEQLAYYYGTYDEKGVNKVLLSLLK